MNTQIMEAAGFHKELSLVSEGLCPTCAKPVGKFRDSLSKKEFAISGMCQACQDGTFGGPAEEENYFGDQKKAFEKASKSGLVILTHDFPASDATVVSVDVDSSTPFDKLLPQDKFEKLLITRSSSGNQHVYVRLTKAFDKILGKCLAPQEIQALVACHLGGDILREALSLNRWQRAEIYSHNMFEKPEEAEKVLKAFPGAFEKVDLDN